MVLFVDRCGESLLPQLTADDTVTLCKQYVPLQRSAPGVHIMEGVTSVDNRDIEAPGSTPLCLCLPPVRGCVGGDCYFPTAHEMHMEMSDKKKALKCRDCLVQWHLFSIAQYGASSSGEQPQGAGISGRPRETEQNINGEDLWTVGHLPMQETL